MLLKEFNQLTADIELAVAAIYDHFAAQFADQVEFSTFWRLSAEAERYHAATIRIHEHTVQPDTALERVELAYHTAREHGWYD